MFGKLANPASFTYLNLLGPFDYPICAMYDDSLEMPSIFSAEYYCSSALHFARRLHGGRA